ncbi:MAG: Ig-like domain-containing protein [Acidobacteria bacterium]|nr:Ig-like domain-containing protein [Acidobacteriota bacterium]
MTRLARRYPQWAAALFLAAALSGCQESDVVAPDGATISMTANPATIVLAGGIQDPNKPVTVIATVSNSIGVPLPGQDVRFQTTAGTLTPAAGTPIETDSFGNATTVLREARQSPTITAK